MRCICIGDDEVGNFLMGLAILQWGQDFQERTVILFMKIGKIEGMHIASYNRMHSTKNVF